MPLRDHFRPPVSKRSSWEGFHAMWPAGMVYQFVRVLPERFIAEPRVHLGTFYEIDICAFEEFSDDHPAEKAGGSAGGGAAALRWLAPAPNLTVATEFPDEYAYEVLIFDADRGRELVAAVEIVSPANKDRPDSRHLFAAKCVNLLAKGVCVSIVDLVTIRRFNLYVEVLKMKRRRDPAFGRDAPPTYAATCRKTTAGGRSQLQTWAFPMRVGEPLPHLPIWLGEDLGITLDLETSYEEVCRILRIP